MKDAADLCLHEIFEEQARRTPENPALEDANISLTYSELDKLADRLAAYLRTLGIGPDEPADPCKHRRVRPGRVRGRLPRRHESWRRLPDPRAGLSAAPARRRRGRREPAHRPHPGAVRGSSAGRDGDILLR